MSYTNDTHGASGDGWYGFDLDGTLAKYDTWEGIDHIGEPVKPMVDLIRKLHDEGKVVKILTARVAPRENAETRLNPYLTDHAVYAAVGHDNEERYRDIYRAPKWTAREFVADWCLRHLGFLPDITHEKDPNMLTLYDDRVKQVVPNRGVLVEDMVTRGPSRLAWFALGFGLRALFDDRSASYSQSDGSRHGTVVKAWGD